MQELKKTMFSHLMKLNGFKRRGFRYDRDNDSVQIDNSAGMWNLVFGDGTVIYCETQEQLVGELVLRNICNQTFY